MSVCLVWGWVVRCLFVSFRYHAIVVDVDVCGLCVVLGFRVCCVLGMCVILFAFFNCVYTFVVGCYSLESVNRLMHVCVAERLCTFHYTGVCLSLCVCLCLSWWFLSASVTWHSFSMHPHTLCPCVFSSSCVYSSPLMLCTLSK